MSPTRVWRACASAMLVVAVLALCLVTVADATGSSGPPPCTAIKGEEVTASKASIPHLSAAVPTADLIVRAPLPSGRLLPAPLPPRTPADLRGEVGSRAPPIRL